MTVYADIPFRGEALPAFYWRPIHPAERCVRNLNKHAAEDLICFADRDISRADLADKMGFRHASVDMGAMHLRVALGDFCARILEEIEVPFRVDGEPKENLQEADRILIEFLQKRGLSTADLPSSSKEVSLQGMSSSLRIEQVSQSNLS